MEPDIFFCEKFRWIIADFRSHMYSWLFMKSNFTESITSNNNFTVIIPDDCKICCFYILLWTKGRFRNCFSFKVIPYFVILNARLVCDVYDRTIKFKLTTSVHQAFWLHKNLNPNLWINSLFCNELTFSPLLTRWHNCCFFKSKCSSCNTSVESCINNVFCNIIFNWLMFILGKLKEI